MARRDRWGDAAIDDYLPNIDRISAQYSAPSTRANSETSLRSLSRSRDRVDFTQMKPAVKAVTGTMSSTGVKYATQRSGDRSFEQHQPLQSNGRNNAVINEFIARQLLLVAKHLSNYRSLTFFHNRSYA
jgi:hypothetical protein